MRRSHIAAVLFLGIFLNNHTARSQSSNSTGTLKWPANPPVGIGTQLSFGPGPLNALHIHYDPTLFPLSLTQPPMIRLSEGDSATTQDFGLLGLMHDTNTTYSSLSTGDDLILHQNYGGDIIITNFSTPTAAFAHGTSIRFATTSDSAHRPLIPPTPHDLERMTITGNGNIGFDLPPDSATGLGNPMDQVQVGGGSMPPLGYTSAIPGLTIYGGNRFEGMPKPGGGLFPVDYRGIYFNHYEDHTTGITQRFTPIGSCGIAFADAAAGGQLQMTCWPPDTAAPLFDSIGSVTLNLTGKEGLEMWSDERLHGGDQYHHEFNVWRPGYGGADSLRNVNGLFLHLTPVLIDTNAGNTNFTSLPHVSPTLGDGHTWMLAVNGSALAKEFVVSLKWPDFVFDPSYQLASLHEVEHYIEANHHLPDVPSATEMAETGVPLGATEAKMMQKIEELTKYVIAQDHKIDRLEAEVNDFKKNNTNTEVK